MASATGTAPVGLSVPASSQKFPKLPLALDRVRPTWLKAAQLVADDVLPEHEIARQCGVTRRALYKWRQNPEFAALVAHFREEINRQMLRYPIARKPERIRRLNDLHERCWQVIEERAQAYARLAAELGQSSDQAQIRRVYAQTFGSTEETEVPPGALTGLVVRTTRQIGSGHAMQIVSEYRVDDELIRRIQSLQEQAARELGQWEERREVTVNVPVVHLVGVDPEAI